MNHFWLIYICILFIIEKKNDSDIVIIVFFFLINIESIDNYDW
jgi:hypothetical protein